ncbi:helix-turn-helix domain-containing protein, partial [Litorivicinus sp.]|nr:helix-turn-helix domain-containing protein [Litorivicinus sp.]
MSSETVEVMNQGAELPGSILRSAREEKGLTIEEMSAISNLTKQVIRSIEDDSYENLASLSFVRGYLKLYAKKLGVEEIVVLEPFDFWRNSGAADGDPEQSIKGFGDHSSAEEKSGGRKFNGLLVGAAIIGILVSAGTFLSYQEGSQEKAPVSENIQLEVSPAVTELAPTISPLLPTTEESALSVPALTPILEPLPESVTITPDDAQDNEEK